MKKFLVTIFFILIGIPAFAATFNCYTGSLPEGRIGVDNQAVWLTVRNAANGTFSSDGAGENFYTTGASNAACSPSACVVRFAAYFDCSGIPTGSTITAATVSFWANGAGTADDTGAFWEVASSTWQGNAAGAPPLTGNAYSMLEGGVGGNAPPATITSYSNQISIAGITANSTSTATLNSAGRALINIGVGATSTKFSLVIGQDASSTAPCSTCKDLVNLNTSAASRPITLSVTYTPAGGATNNDEQNWFLILYRYLKDSIIKPAYAYL